MIADLKRNSVWSVIEVLSSGVALFLLYKYVVSMLGLKALGVWSLVLATTSLARLGDLGVAAGLSRFVAISLANNDRASAGDFVGTALITTIVGYTLIGMLAIGPLWWVLEFVVPLDSLGQARALLPYAVASFALLNINAVTLSALVGTQRTDLKCKIVILTLFVQISTVVGTVPFLGLVGLGLGQLAQLAVSIALSWLSFRSLLGTAAPSIFLRNFSRSAFRQLFGFGLRLQLMNLISFSFEPATKLTISAVCGLEVLGIFEMAYRMVLQVRHTVAAPMQQLVPAFARLNEIEPNETATLYERATTEVIVTGIPLLVFAAALSPAVSWVWLGGYQQHFVAFALLLYIGWLANILAMPAYLLGVGSGYVRWNLAGHAITSAGSPLLAYMLGTWLGPTAMVAGISIALATGAACTMALNCRAMQVRLLPSIGAMITSMRIRREKLAVRVSDLLGS